MVGMLSPITAQIGRPERVDIGASLIGGIQAGQDIQGARLHNQAAEQKNTEIDFQVNLRNLKIMNGLMKQARQYPQEQRGAYVQSLDQNMLAAIGVTPDVLAQTPLDDASLSRLINQSDAILSSAMPQQQIDVGTYNPRDYTPESWADFVKTKDAGKLKRYESSQVVKIGGVDYLVDKTTGERTPLSSLNEVTGNVQAISGAGEKGKLNQQLEIKPQIETAVTGAKDRVEAASEAADKAIRLENGLAIYDNLIGEIDKGANTSAFTSWAPTIKDATRRFEQGARELGLGVISNTTFGALSEAELKLAMETAVPLLKPPAMKQWLLDKKAAQQKLANEMFRYAEHLDNGGTKVTWVRRQKDLRSEQQSTPQSAQQAQKQGGQIMIDANGNRAMVYPDGTYEEL